MPPQGFGPCFHTIAVIPVGPHCRRRSTPAALGVMAWLRFWGYTASLMLGADLIKKKKKKKILSPRITNSLTPAGYFFFLLDEVVVFFFFEPEPQFGISHTSFLSAIKFNMLFTLACCFCLFLVLEHVDNLRL